ncbi:hypothetical protein HPB48_018466 [Haemaphysalis longicornis]|uniref:Uncharacterized protein n=1 Tax=Haemaphysalis longicornis TaxID=44386 RepID=A0A9J6FAF7_HAELO|nr:hypothetical protein HPB48_018466 [Haemaphysalis longicornis]
MAENDKFIEQGRIFGLEGRKLMEFVQQEIARRRDERNEERQRKKEEAEAEWQRERERFEREIENLKVEMYLVSQCSSLEELERNRQRRRDEAKEESMREQQEAEQGNQKRQEEAEQEIQKKEFEQELQRKQEEAQPEKQLEMDETQQESQKREEFPQVFGRKDREAQMGNQEMDRTNDILQLRELEGPGGVPEESAALGACDAGPPEFVPPLQEQRDNAGACLGGSQHTAAGQKQPREQRALAPSVRSGTTPNFLGRRPARDHSGYDAFLPARERATVALQQARKGRRARSSDSRGRERDKRLRLSVLTTPRRTTFRNISGDPRYVPPRGASYPSRSTSRVTCLGG